MNTRIILRTKWGFGNEKVLIIRYLKIFNSINPYIVYRRIFTNVSNKILGVLYMRKILTNKELSKPIFLIILILFSCIFLTYGMATVNKLGIYSAVISGESMEKTLYDGTKLLLIDANIKQIERGDLVSIAAASQDGQYFNATKRIIALPNEVIDIKGADVYINGVLLEEPYAYYSKDSNDDLSLTLGKNEYFFMGDNRMNSVDSRHVGPFGKQSILSIVWKYKN